MNEFNCFICQEKPRVHCLIYCAECWGEKYGPYKKVEIVRPNPKPGLGSVARVGKVLNISKEIKHGL